MEKQQTNIHIVQKTAQHLASLGDYQSARSLLAAMPSDSPETMNLQAQIYAQECQYEKAKSVWQCLLERYPEFEQAQEGIEYVERLQDSFIERVKPRVKIWGPVVVCLAALIFPVWIIVKINQFDQIVQTQQTGNTSQSVMSDKASTTELTKLKEQIATLDLKLDQFLNNEVVLKSKKKPESANKSVDP